MKYVFGLTLGLFAITLPAAADTVPTTPAGWLAQMSDFTANSLPARAPENFVGLLDAATEPAFHTQRFSNLTEPAYWGKITDTLSHPGVANNMAAAATPQTLADWTQAMMDPRFYQAIATVIGSPEKWARWREASLTSTSYQPFFKPFDPALQARWQTEMYTPANWQAFFNPLASIPPNPPVR